MANKKEAKLAQDIMKTICNGIVGLSPLELVQAVCTGIAGAMGAVGTQNGKHSGQFLIKSIGLVLVNVGPELVEQIDKEATTQQTTRTQKSND